MNNKKLFIVVIVAVIVMIISGVTLMLLQGKSKNTKSKYIMLDANDGFATYSLENIKVNDEYANLVISYDIEKKEQYEKTVKKGDIVTVQLLGNDCNLKVKEITSKYILLSIDGLGIAPVKENFSIDLRKNYTEVKVLRNSGVKLSKQATDIISDGDVYLFYVQ